MFVNHMNPQRGRHISGEHEEHGEQRPEDHNGGDKPSIFIHSHSGGHTVHLFHSDGTHEIGNDDHVHEALGGDSAHADVHEHGTGIGVD
jgi:hypothetical protein